MYIKVPVIYWAIFVTLVGYLIYTGANKDSPGRDFSRQISTVFGTFLKKYLRYRNFIYLIGKP